VIQHVVSAAPPSGTVSTFGGSRLGGLLRTSGIPLIGVKLLLEHPTDNDYTVQVHQGVFLSKALQDGFHQQLEHYSSIANAKGHNCELPQPMSSRESCIFHVAGVQSNLPVINQSLNSELGTT
jgi:hypothetical protein